MRIGIDVRYLSHGLVGGVHTYVRQLVPALLAAAPGDEFVLYADTKRPFELGALPANARLRLLPYRSPLSSVANDLLMRRAIARDRVDVMHFPANYGFAPQGVPTVITLHDAINILPLREIVRGHRKDARTLVMMSYLHLCTTAALRRASLVLAVSEHARREIARVGRYPLDRIAVTPHAPAGDLRRVADPIALAALRERHGLGRPFVLADGLKNPAALVRAWRRLPAALRERHQIVFFARREPLPVVREAEASGFARLLINPPREDLVGLYSLAEAFVFPSWVEGFGIPLIEAMACGAPVIASDRGAIPEVLGGAGLLADAEDDATLAGHIASVLSDPAVAQAMRERGYARAAQFSWEHTARRTLDIYQHVLADSSLALPSAGIDTKAF